ncbi:MAG: hypothetical protein IAF94_17415 [Pirellulaceae bacterium]|nr:hypothetical protein [Pirellulaceae bacterium]
MAAGAVLDVLRVGETGAPPYGTADPQLLQAAAELDRILISGDKKTMPMHLADFLAAGKSSPGLLMIRGDPSIPQLVEWLEAIATECSADEYGDTVSWVP